MCSLPAKPPRVVCVSQLRQLGDGSTVNLVFAVTLKNGSEWVYKPNLEDGRSRMFERDPFSGEIQEKRIWPAIKGAGFVRQDDSALREVGFYEACRLLGLANLVPETFLARVTGDATQFVGVVVPVTSGKSGDSHGRYLSLDQTVGSMQKLVPGVTFDEWLGPDVNTIANEMVSRLPPAARHTARNDPAVMAHAWRTQQIAGHIAALVDVSVVCGGSRPK